MRFEPRPWQPAMMNHIAEHPRCAVFAAMGSGKTSAVLIALQGITLLDEGPGLILAPRRVAQSTWPKEVAKWDGLDLKIIAIKGDASQRARCIKRKADFYTINYEQIPWLVTHLGDDWPFRTIIADESTRLKGFRLRQGGARTKALAKVAWRSDIERFILLTGTPAPNGIQNLWGQIWFLDKGERLGRTFDIFTSRWFRPSYSGYGVEPFKHSQKEIQDRISDICITIDPGDYIPIDQPIERIIEVELPPAARELYSEMERTMFIEALEVEAPNAAARTNKCLQLANGAVYHDEHGNWTEVHDVKLDALESIIEEAGGMPVLVGYQFKSDLARLKKRFPQGRTLDQTTEDEWNAGKVPLLFAHPASAGHGLNLQWGSNILVDFSSGWDLELDQQLIERIGPMRQMQAGLDRPVYRYRIVAIDTVDEMVAERRAGKKSVQDILLAAMNRRISRGAG